jgi:glutamate dehydrogenase
MTDLNGEIDALDARIPGALQLELYKEVQNLLIDRVIWFIRNKDLGSGLAGIVSHYREGIEEMAAKLDTVVTAAAREALQQRAADLVKDGVPDPLANKIARLPLLAAATDVILIADRAEKPVETVATTYFAAREYLQLDGLVRAAREIDVEDRFDRLALDRAVDSIGASERKLAANMLTTGKTGAAAVEAWAGARKGEIERVRGRIQEIAASGFTLSKLVVVAGLLNELVKE